MPGGLLQTKHRQPLTVQFGIAFLAELLGVLIFTLYGGSGPAEYAAWTNGFTLAVLVYATANVSGGHLNPAVTIATMISGHITLFAGLIYLIAQVSGACLGVLLQVALLPNASVGMGEPGVGCFHTQQGADRGMVYGWEAVMTFFLVSTVYAVAIGEPSFKEAGPLAIGLALFVSVFTGGTYTGAALNPARVLGPAIVYHCYWRYVWVYILGQLTGAILAALVSWPLYGSAGPILRGIVRPLQKTGVFDKMGEGNSKLQHKLHELPKPLKVFFGTDDSDDDDDDSPKKGDQEQGEQGLHHGGINILDTQASERPQYGGSILDTQASERGLLTAPGQRTALNVQGTRLPTSTAQAYVGQPQPGRL
ncbi:hypothetical protein WJX72_010747 [[Myrmecia] bisecta]|uniref:Aquaporin n=1 Tax=[Myrmecia] bisecta TaxID=41462 RepID=A0AAW1PA22_9CHLO